MTQAVWGLAATAVAVQARCHWHQTLNRCHGHTTSTARPKPVKLLVRGPIIFVLQVVEAKLEAALTQPLES